MKKIYTILLSAVLAAMLLVGLISLVDKDPTRSEAENRELSKKPRFSFSALFDGSYIPALETYYADTFPMREKLLAANRTLNKFYYYSGSGEDAVLVIGGNTGAEQGGQSLDSVLPQTPDGTPGTPQQPQTPDETPGSPQQPQTPTDTEDPESGGETHKPPETPEQTPDVPEKEEIPALDNPDESEASYAGNVIVVGTRAMEIPTALDDVITSYAGAVNSLAAAMPEGTRTISLLTCNGGEFYSPESMHTGLHSQKEMIQRCYDQMAEDIITVDACTALRAHTDEYIFFRTDHHWTQLGAYYAYTAFCEAAGFKAVPLTEFETGRYDTFLGSMYTFTSGYPQNQTLKDNPDYLDYYLPVVETHAQYYANAELQNGVPVSVVYTKLDDSVSNKYLCFIGGDTPVCVIETAVEDGPTCIMLKESYGNAFAPFLTSHYSKIIVIDPREFNRDGKPSLDLTAFAAEQQIDDLIVINYPYMINSTYYVSWLNRLVGADQ